MNVQYITDDTGKTTGVFIPISEWIDLKTKYEGLDNNVIIPLHHKEIALKRTAEYDKNPEIGLDFETAMFELERE